MSIENAVQGISGGGGGGKKNAGARSWVKGNFWEKKNILRKKRYTTFF